MATSPPPLEVRRRPVRVILAGVGAAALAGVAGSFASFTWQATACVMLGGAVIVALGVRGPRRRRPPRAHPRRGTLAWMIWTVGFLGWEASTLLGGSRPSHPSLSLLLDPVLELQAAKSVAFLGWLLGGWVLVRR